MRSLSSWSSRKRRTSSSVSEDLPEPPVPVMPSTGTVVGAAEQVERRRAARPASASVSARASVAVSPASRSSSDAGGCAARSTSHSRIISVDHPGQAEALAVLGGEDPRDAALVQQLDLARHDHAAAAAVDLDVPGAALAQQVDEVA